MIQLPKLALARKIMPCAVRRISRSQNAYPRARSTEVHLLGPNRFATNNVQEMMTTNLVGLNVAGAFDSVTLVKPLEALVLYKGGLRSAEP